MKDLIQEGRNIQDKFKDGVAKNTILKEAGFAKTEKEVRAALKRLMNDPVTGVKINPDLTVDIKRPGDLITIADGSIDQLPVQFGKLTGTVQIICKKLTSLVGCPKEVVGDFGVFETKITSLKGGPIKVSGYYTAQNNKKLTSMEGMAMQVGERIDFSFNGLTSLKGCPKVINGRFSVNGNKLTSLEGGPTTVKGGYDCAQNDNLNSLEGAPNTVDGKFICFRKKGYSDEVKKWVLKNVKAKQYVVGEWFGDTLDV